MRYLVGFVCLLVLMASPLSASAKAGEDEGGSRLERWHPEAFVDPSKPAPESTLQLELDSAGLEVTPTVPLAVEEETYARRRRVAMGVSISFIIVGVVIGAAVGVSVSQIKRRELLGSSGAGIAF